MKAYGVSTTTAPLIRLGIPRTWVIIFTLRSLQPWYSLNMMLAGKEFGVICRQILSDETFLIAHIELVLWQIWSRDSSVGIATRYGLDGPGIESRWGQDFSAPFQTMGTGSFPGGSKADEAWRSPTTASNVKVKERVQLYLYSLSGPSWPLLGRALPLPLRWEITK